MYKRDLLIPLDKLKKLKDSYSRNLTRPLAFRLKQIDGIIDFLNTETANIEKALYADLKRPPLEAYTGDIGSTLSEAKFLRKYLKKWMKPTRVWPSLLVLPAKAYVYPEPLGVVLVIAPWNYPVQLSLTPVLGALAAGNCVVLKPSEIAPATSRLLAEVLPRYVDPNCLQVITGGVPETTALLKEKFDHIFYTGNSRIATIVMEAAAKHLTPVTLELGGKSPCVVDQHVDLSVAVKRILWGKFSNAGQVCLAPDYVLVHKKIASNFFACVKQTLRDFYGDNTALSPNYSRIINPMHFKRLVNLLDEGEIFYGGRWQEEDCYIEPTIMKNISNDSRLMQEEIFGPILPVIPVQSMRAAIDYINAKPKPLTLSIFSKDNAVQEQFIQQTSSGSVVVNHTTVNIIVPRLPFGGVGLSGMGAYHGKASFDTFSHQKSVLIKPTWGDIPLIYPPYTTGKLKWIRRLLSL